MQTILCIAGPTASGKSAWAVKYAKQCDGVIINADALQVYKELQILSARPTRAEMQGIPHHLFGHVSAGKRYSVGKWLREVDPLIIDILACGRTPILVGGTGLYFKALADGLAHIPAPGPQAIEWAQGLLDKNGIAELRKHAEALDPVAASRVLGDDPQRLLRIVAVAQGTDNKLSDWQRVTRPVIPPGSWQGMVVLPSRRTIYHRINNRFDDMVRANGLEEAKNLHAMGLSPDLPAMKAIGVRELIAYLNGEMPFDEAIEKAKQETRRFAKRQVTWIRARMQDWKIISKC